MPRHPKSPNSQKPINPKKRAIQTARKRESRGRIYLAIVVIVIVAIGVGWYVYSSAQGPPDFAIAAPTGVTIHAGNPVTSRVNVTAVNNFVSLAQSGFYRNLVWHRIVQGFVIQTGDPITLNGGGNRNTWGQGGSGQTVPLEIDPSLRNNLGYLGMARGSDFNSGSSQF